MLYEVITNGGEENPRKGDPDAYRSGPGMGNQHDRNGSEHHLEKRSDVVHPDLHWSYNFV